MIEYREHIDAKKRPYGHFEVKLISKSGIVKKVVRKKVDSFIHHFWQLCDAQVNAADPGVTGLDGTSEQISTGTHWEMNGTSGSYVGLAIGTGSQTVTIGTATLASYIQHGTGAGQMEYGVCSRQIENSERDLHLTRTFTNNSGASIDVTEVAATISSSNSQTDPGRVVPLLVDNFPSAITVANGESIIVDYTFGWNVGNSNWKAFSSWWGDSSKDTWHRFNGGTAQFTAESLDRMTNRWDADNDRDGLIVGTGSTPPTVTDWDLESLISHGSSAGQLDYGPTQSTLNIDTGNNKAVWTWERVFNNNSGGDITINEVGLVLSSQGSFSNSIPMLGFRGVFGSPPTIVAGTSRTVKVIFDYSV